MARLKSELSSEEYVKLEGMMWILRKKHECLSEAHSCVLRLTHIFNTHSNRQSTLAKINRWIISVEKSELLSLFQRFYKIAGEPFSCFYMVL